MSRSIRLPMPRPALRPPPPRRRAPTSRQTPVPDAARVPKRASARRATCRGPPVPTPRAPRSAPMPRNLSFLATEPRSGAKTVGAFATIRRRPGVSLAKASTSVEIGGKTLPARTRTRFRGHKSPLLLHGRSKRKEPASGVRLSAISPNLIFHGDGLLAPGMQSGKLRLCSSRGAGGLRGIMAPVLRRPRAALEGGAAYGRADGHRALRRVLCRSRDDRPVPPQVAGRGPGFKGMMRTVSEQKVTPLALQSTRG